MFLFFDTETTGLPKIWSAPLSDLNNWPRMVQLAWLVFDSEKNMLKERNFIIKPEGFIIPSDVSKIHGITTEYAIRVGVDLRIALNEFYLDVSSAKYLVAHNMRFDEKIVGAEFLRNNIENIIASKEKICTMLQSKEYCGLQGNYGYKWPRLSELHFKLFREEFQNAHNALNDISATAKCFWELKKLGVIKN